MHAVGTEFASVNVLEDDEVRNGIKVYSEWPTIPQASNKQNTHSRMKFLRIDFN